MSKAVLVMNMPSSCDVCPFCEVYETPSGLMECNNQLSEEYGCDVSDYEGTRAEGCPLRELPEKRKSTRMPIAPGLPWEYTDYAKGWNACIDEITGGRK